MKLLGAGIMLAAAFAALPLFTMRSDLLYLGVQIFLAVVLAQSSMDESQTVEETIIAHQLGCTILIVPRMHELYRDGPDV